jgi:hypothetical protein
VVASYDIAYPENENSLHNVKTACDYLNGYILPENAVFSYNDVVGNRTKERDLSTLHLLRMDVSQPHLVVVFADHPLHYIIVHW